MWICVTPKSVSVNNSYKIPKQKKKAERKGEKGRDCTARWAKKVRLCAGSSRGNCRHGYILPAAAPWFPESDECKTGAVTERERERDKAALIAVRGWGLRCYITDRWHNNTQRLKTAWNLFASNSTSLMPCTWFWCCISLYSV